MLAERAGSFSSSFYMAAALAAAAILVSGLLERPRHAVAHDESRHPGMQGARPSSEP